MKKVVVLFLFLLAITGCTEKAHEVTIEYNMGGDKVVVYLTSDGPVSVGPDNLVTYTGYEFIGWYTDESFENEFDLDTIITEDISIYAKWERLAPSFDGLEEYYVELGDTFDALDGVSAEDVLEGDITSSIEVGTFDVSTIGDKSITYTVANSGGVTITEFRTIHVVEEILPPEIEGVEDVAIYAGEDFDFFEGITATDEIDGDVTENIVLVNMPNMKEIGFHDVVYEVTNSYGKTTEVTRTILINKAEISIFLDYHLEISQMMEEYALVWGEEHNVDVNIIACDYSSCDYTLTLQNRIASGNVPDIFAVQSDNYLDYEDYALDLSDQPWVGATELEFVINDKVISYPTSVEAWGMIYNEEILLAAFEHEGAGRTIDSLKDISQAEYEEVFQAVQAYYDANNITDHAVVSMAAGYGMQWVTGLHSFNSYLSYGINPEDNLFIDQVLLGEVDEARLNTYADWVELLFTYSDPDILFNGEYSIQVNKFARGEAAFLHQGSWTMSTIELYEDSFNYGMLPYGALETGNNGITADSFVQYAIYKDTEMETIALKFLNDLYFTELGQTIANEYNMINPFKESLVEYSNPMQEAVHEWIVSENLYGVQMNHLPLGFGMESLGEIYTEYALSFWNPQAGISKEEFILDLKEKIAELS